MEKHFDKTGTFKLRKG